MKPESSKKAGDDRCQKWVEGKIQKTLQSMTLEQEKVEVKAGSGVLELRQPKT